MSMTEGILAGRYRLEEQIATGGMGSVWRAHDEVLQRPVAVKLLHDTLAADEVAAERFRREALMAASLSHPNMANVFDYIEDNGTPGIVMELVESETLSTMLARRGALPPAEAVRIASAVLEALIAAHAAGIVHRDIKPGNVLLTPTGRVKVADFGIARSLGDTTLTAAGNVMGTAHYSAPEQVSGRTATAASDLYSLGIVLYEMLSGAKPFSGDTAVAVAMARLTEQPRPLREVDPSVPAALDAVVMRALARDPADRFADAKTMQHALQAAAVARQVDRTAELVLGPTDETIALSSAALSKGSPKDQGSLARAVPPRRWRRRLATILLPLVLLGLLAWALASVLGPSTAIVPTFEGKTLAQAEALAAEAGLDLDVDRVSSTRRKDLVLKQSVAHGREVTEGREVTIEVSLGDLVNTPDLLGMTQDEARAALARRDLILGNTSARIDANAEAFTVVDQDPDEGRNLERGESVGITLALPEERDEDRKGKRGKDDDDDDDDD